MTSFAAVPAQQRSQRKLLVAALGVVFGDIGTSPLYTVRECFRADYGLTPNAADILGILSLIFWTLMIVIAGKYLAFMLRADNRGEGGIMALMSLILKKTQLDARQRTVLVTLGLLGAALFYGDGLITPAISVLSAVEGITVIDPNLDRLVVPIALAILIGLFGGQRQAGAAIGSLFGPVMMVWFVSLAAIGLSATIQTPQIWAALDPAHAVAFFVHKGWTGMLALGAVVLAIAGAEALYLDLGRFGPAPIRKAGYLIVLPALVLNYFGQGALLMDNPAAAANPFFLLVPQPLGIPLILLAILATVIASQAVVAGAFSLTAQAIQLGFFPRLSIHYTSEEERGYVYIPWINWAFMIGLIGLVLWFRSSSNLAAAYGLAVTGTMLLTTLLALILVFRVWHWNRLVGVALALVLLPVDLALFTGNLLKVTAGGWLPLGIGVLVFTLLKTWKDGRLFLLQKLQAESMPVAEFLAQIAAQPPIRVPGTAVYLTSSPEGIPQALLHNLRHNKVLHEHIVLMTVITEPVPRVAPEKRREIHRLAENFLRINLHYGFMESPNVPRVLRSSSREFDIRIAETTFFLSRETLIPSERPPMALWRVRLFASMSRNTASAIHFFRIPPECVVEIGVQVTL